MRGVRIAKPMFLIGLLAVGFAALRSGSEMWARGLLMSALVILAFSLIGVVYRDGVRRAWWFGFALFGWGYMALTVSPWLDDEVGAKLPTHRVLLDVFQESMRRRVLSSDPAALPGAPMGPGRVSVSSSATVSNGLAIARTPGGIAEFLLIGNCLFALLGAFCGGMAAVWMCRTRVVSEALQG